MRKDIINTQSLAPIEIGIDQHDVAWAERIEAYLLAVILLMSAAPWGLYAWNTIRTFHLVPALLSVFAGIAGCVVTARLALLLAEWLLQLLLPRYRRVRGYRKAVAKKRP